MTYAEEMKDLKSKLKEARESTSDWKGAHRHKIEELKNKEHELEIAKAVGRVYFQCFEMLLNVRQAEVTHKFEKEQK